MKLRALNALIAAVDEGSLRAASRRLSISQPALTKMIRELELELATPLLERSSRGVLLTTAGKLLCEHARKADHELRSAVDKIQQLDGRMVGLLRVSAVPLAVMLLIPEALRTFTRAYPQVRLHVSEELYMAQLQKLRSNEVDITVGGVPYDLPAGEFVVEPLMHTSMEVCVRKGSPYENVSHLAELTQAQWVYTGTYPESGYAKQFFESHGLAAPAVGMVVNSTLALVSLVSMSDYICLMPKQIAENPLIARYVSVLNLIQSGLPLQVGALVSRNVVLSAPVRHFLAHLHRAAHQITKTDLSLIIK